MTSVIQQPTFASGNLSPNWSVPPLRRAEANARRCARPCASPTPRTASEDHASLLVEPALLGLPFPSLAGDVTYSDTFLRDIAAATPIPLAEARRCDPLHTHRVIAAVDVQRGTGD